MKVQKDYLDTTEVQICRLKSMQTVIFLLVINFIYIDYSLSPRKFHKSAN